MEKNLNALQSQTARLRGLNEDLKRETTAVGAKMKHYYAVCDWLCRSDLIIREVKSLLAESNQKMSHLGVGGFFFTRVFEMNKFGKLVLERLKQVDSLIDTCDFDTSMTSTTVEDHPRGGAYKAIRKLQYEQDLHIFENEIEQDTKDIERLLTNIEEASLARSIIIVDNSEADKLRAEVEELSCKLERKIKQFMKKALADKTSK